MTFINDLPASPGNALPVYPGAPAGQSFRAYFPASAVGANKSHLEIFNGSSRAIRLLSLLMIKDATLAVTGAVSIECFLQRTTAEGSGGTLAVAEGVSDATPSVCAADPRLPGLPSGINVRYNSAVRPTAGASLARRQTHPEEGGGASGSQYPLDFIAAGRPLIVPPGTGVEVYQGAVLSVGAVIFDASFEVE